MKLKISKRFIKDSEKITDKRLLAKLQQVLIEASQPENLFDMANITELSGYSNYMQLLATETVLKQAEVIAIELTG